jgi:cob(I)alamin adenosyltransferase
MAEYEFSQITTRGGDTGESSLADGERRRKDDLYFETLGALDELVSYLGVVRSGMDRKNADVLSEIQKTLQNIAGMVAVPRRSELFEAAPKIGKEEVKKLEKEEERLMKKTTIPSEFIRPGKTSLSSHIHVARTICRRTERRIVTCIRERGLSHLIPAQNYLNRLADYLFILAVWKEKHE